MKFIFISNTISDVPEDKFRDIIFDDIVATKIYKRFDTSREFWDIFGSRKKSRRKKLGYYENIDNSWFVTLAVNPKEYLEFFKNSKLNKKHKGIKKRSSRLEFQNFANRMKSLVNWIQRNVSIFFVSRRNGKKICYQNQTLLTKRQEILISRRSCFFSIRTHKFKRNRWFYTEKGQKIEKYFWEEKEALLDMDKNSLKNNPGLYFYHQILMSQLKIFNINQKKK